MNRFSRLVVAVVGGLFTPVVGLAADTDRADAEAAILKQTNAVRAQHAAEPLTRNDKLDAVARAFAEYLAKHDKFAHDADGKQPWDRASEGGYEHSFLSENIGFYQSQQSPGAAALAKLLVQSWFDSKGHRKNMLDPDVREIGIGVAIGPEGKYYGVQMFAVPKSAGVEVAIRNPTQTTITYTIDGKAFTLEPGVTRTHQHGKPPTLIFDQPADAPKAAKRLEKKPRSKTMYVVKILADGSLTLE